MLLALGASLLLASPACAQRVALLIGNASYQVGRLTNPPNDVREMEAALRAIGFKVESKLNLNQNEMKRALRDFGAAAKGAEFALLYYSGHGTQAFGENYLLPVGAEIQKESDYDIYAVAANAILRQITEARPKASMLILDACRDNPYAAVTKSQARGLARMDPPEHSAIAFSTAPGRTAGDEGHYARVLAAQLRVPGQELARVFRNAAAEVARMTQNRQQPRLSEWSINEDVYLAGTPDPPPAAPPPAMQAGQVFKDCPACPEMVVIPAGSFLMGSPAAEPQRNADEGPQRRVNVASFAMGKYEVTQGQWKALMGSNPSHFSLCGDDCPVESVFWNDAQEYAKRLSAKTGKSYRLPSEAEWEYAARGGTTTPFHTGVTITTAQANFDGNATYNGSATGTYRTTTVPVGSFGSNAFGLHDVHGNVLEWVQDCYAGDAYAGKAPSDGKAFEVAGCSARVRRGGSWSLYPADARSAFRSVGAPDMRGNNIGLRLARSLP